jgi:TatA/E family protein of Tat protein translocase
MFQGLGSTEWVVIALVVVALFGGNKLPGFFKGLGDAVKGLKNPQKIQPKK